MNKFFLLAIHLTFMIFIFSCTDNQPEPVNDVQWKKLGLDGHIVHKLQIYKNQIYVATDKGFYTKNRNDNSQNWDLLGFENESCQSFLILNNNEIIVSLVNRQDPEQTGIYKTTDGGTNWTNFSNGFGGEGGIEPAFDITVNPSDSSIFYAIGHYVIAKSTDEGETWEPIFGDWHNFATGMSFIEVSPLNNQSIWVGGQNAIEQGYLIHSNDGGVNWEEHYNLVPPPSVGKEIAFHPNRPQEVLVGFEGALIRSPDNGNSWETLIESEENRFFFGLAINRTNPDLIYAAGWIKRYDEPQPFIIFTSTDGGRTWTEHTYDAEDFGGVYDMEMISENGTDKLYLGLYKGGVYEVTFDHP